MKAASGASIAGSTEVVRLRQAVKVLRQALESLDVVERELRAAGWRANALHVTAHMNALTTFAGYIDPDLSPQPAATGAPAKKPTYHEMKQAAVPALTPEGAERRKERQAWHAAYLRRNCPV